VLSANTSWYLANFRASTIRSLRESGYRVVCIAPEDEYTEQLTGLGCDWRPLFMDNAGSNPVKDLGLLIRFIRYYREIAPAVVLHFTVKNNVYGTWAASLLRIPALNNVSGLGTAFIRDGMVPKVVRALYRLSQPLATLVFCQNSEDMELLVANRFVPEGRLRKIPGSGVDLGRFQPRNRDSSGGIRFLFAGRMLEDKGLRELMEAMRALSHEYPEAELWLCGFTDVANVSAISLEQIRRWGEESYVFWLGSTQRIEDVLAQVDCVVLPSYREGLPRSLLEAGAMGLPVIATNVPGCREVVGHGTNGLLCEPRSADSLLDAMRRFCNMPVHEREFMGARGREIVERLYDEKIVVSATLEAVESCTSRKTDS
jgi:glycosyltransferase involved in cell wall biosynthesis